MRPTASLTALSLGLTAILATPAAAIVPDGRAPGNHASYSPDVSANGRFVVFASDANNLTPGDTNGKRDVFLRDLQRNTTRLVSFGLLGRPANKPSYFPTVSNDGRYVAFMSDATNLVKGDTNGKVDVFRADLLTGQIVRVNTNSGGVQSNGSADGARIAASGNSIVYRSEASNLVKGDSNGAADIFLWDASDKGARRVSMTPQGNQNLQASRMPDISPNGALVTWIGPSGLHEAAYRWDRRTAKVSSAAELWHGGEHVVRASNAGPSWSDTSSDGYNSYYEIVANAQPTDASFTAGYSNLQPLTDFDLSAWGAMVAMVNPDTSGVEIRDKATGDLSGPPLASLAESGWHNVALSSGGTNVAGVDSTGQVKVWSWQSGLVTTASVGIGGRQGEWRKK